jgi:hypothetical protein
MNLKEKVRDLVSKFELLTKDEVELLVEKTIVDTFDKGTLLLKGRANPDQMLYVG